MDRLIKVKQQVYNDLDDLRVGRETFSMIVARLIRVFKTIQAIPDTLGPNHPATAKKDSFGRMVRTRFKEE